MYLQFNFSKPALMGLPHFQTLAKDKHVANKHRIFFMSLDKLKEAHYESSFLGNLRRAWERKTA